MPSWKDSKKLVSSFFTFISFATSWENLSSGVSNQVRLKPACLADETSLGHEISAIASRGIILCRGRKQERRWSDCADAQTDLHLLLFAYDIRHVFSWSGSFHKLTFHFSSHHFLLKSFPPPFNVYHGCETKFWVPIICVNIIWTASSEFGTYRLCEQRRFRRACASAPSRQNLRCSLIQAVSQEEPSDRKPDPMPLWMAGHAQLKFVMTECSKTQIHLTGLICKWVFELPYSSENRQCHLKFGTYTHVPSLWRLKLLSFGINYFLLSFSDYLEHLWNRLEYCNSKSVLNNQKMMTESSCC